jgi:8-oxo-dGTP pyrophosphatase MutT (NUDIX family)
LTVNSSHELPPELADRARMFVESGQRPAATEDAATVVLLRPARCGIEAYLLRRHSRMAFAAGMYAFPGGRVDPHDYDPDIGWVGGSTYQWAESFKCSPDLARALVCAAVRETFEESGVLLAGTAPGAVVSDLSARDWEADRKALIDRTLSLGGFLQSRRLLVRSDLLRPWAHWITPEFEPRRYDTRFFLAALPAGQEARDVSGEADAVAWMQPGEAVAAADRREMAMLPPTYVTLQELSRFDTVDEALAAAGDPPA